MSRHPVLRNAARIAHTFTMDPIVVLEETDGFKNAVRAAAHNAVMIDLANQAAEARRQQGRR